MKCAAEGMIRRFCLNFGELYYRFRWEDVETSTLSACAFSVKPNLQLELHLQSQFGRHRGTVLLPRVIDMFLFKQSRHCMHVTETRQRHFEDVRSISNHLIKQGDLTEPSVTLVALVEGKWAELACALKVKSFSSRVIAAGRNTNVRCSDFFYFGILNTQIVS